MWTVAQPSLARPAYYAAAGARRRVVGQTRHSHYCPEGSRPSATCIFDLCWSPSVAPSSDFSSPFQDPALVVAIW